MTYLPDGVYIYVDPITVTAKTRFVETTVAIEQTLPWPALLSDRVAVTAEAGHRHTRSRIVLRSALIRRDDTGTDNQSFAGLGLRLDLGPRRATRLDLGVRRIRGTDPVARLGLERRF